MSDTIQAPRKHSTVLLCPCRLCCQVIPQKSRTRVISQTTLPHRALIPSACCTVSLSYQSHSLYHSRSCYTSWLAHAEASEHLLSRQQQRRLLSDSLLGYLKPRWGVENQQARKTCKHKWRQFTFWNMTIRETAIHPHTMDLCCDRCTPLHWAQDTHFSPCQ